MAGFCIVAGPEGTLLETHEAGVHIVNIDLDRMRYLRSTIENLDNAPGAKVKPAALTQWRRPELYGELIK